MRDADVGAGLGPGSAAERFAARAWTTAAAAAASAAGRPAASSEPIMPDNTSPDPAVAAQDWPAGLRYTRPPGSATTVTLGADLEVHGQSGHLTPQFSDSRIVNLGTIAADGGGQIHIGSRQDGAYGNAGSFDNQGTLSATGTGNLSVHPSNWRNTNAITASGGGVISLWQNGDNSGPITVDGGATRGVFL